MNAAPSSLSSLKEPILGRLKRRVVTLPALVLIASLGLVLGTLILPVVILVDTLTGPIKRRFCRVLSVILLVSAVHLIYLIPCFLNGGLAWLVPQLGVVIDRWLQKTWSTILFRGTCWLLGLRLLPAEGEQTDPTRPVLVFSRHASILDVFLPVLFIASCGHFKLRFVIKNELKSNGLMDLVGQRLPNAFIDRLRGDESREAIRILGDNLEIESAVVIYPEGTRGTEARRAKALARLEEAGRTAEAQRAAQLKHLLPPRPAGVLALLDQAPQAQVCFLAHEGMDQLTGLKNLVRGKLVGKTIRVKRTIFAPEAIPTEKEARIEWLWSQWEAMDRWLT
jgi:1-acyl-sn-glycerol-3-phosphate acyltransferase